MFNHVYQLQSFQVWRPREAVVDAPYGALRPLNFCETKNAFTRRTAVTGAVRIGRTQSARERRPAAGEMQITNCCHWRQLVSSHCVTRPPIGLKPPLIAIDNLVGSNSIYPTECCRMILFKADR